MSTLIAYASRHGTTEQCAFELRDRLRGGAQVVDLCGSDAADRRELERMIDESSVVVVGGPIYAGRVGRQVRRFCERYRERLLGRKVALFICCLQTGDRARAELEAAYPGWLRAHASATGIFGGAARAGELGRLDRLRLSRVSGSSKDLSCIDRDAIRALASRIDAH